MEVPLAIQRLESAESGRTPPILWDWSEIVPGRVDRARFLMRLTVAQVLTFANAAVQMPSALVNREGYDRRVSEAAATADARLARWALEKNILSPDVVEYYHAGLPK